MLNPHQALNRARAWKQYVMLSSGGFYWPKGRFPHVWSNLFPVIVAAGITCDFLFWMYPTNISPGVGSIWPLSLLQRLSWFLKKPAVPLGAPEDSSCRQMSLTEYHAWPPSWKYLILPISHFVYEFLRRQV